jgi:hypothetical protein
MRPCLTLLLALWLPLQLLLSAIGGHVHLPGLHDAQVTTCEHAMASAGDPHFDHDHASDHELDHDSGSASDLTDTEHRHCHCQLLGMPAPAVLVDAGAARPALSPPAAPPCLEYAPTRPERPQWASLA